MYISVTGSIKESLNIVTKIRQLAERHILNDFKNKFDSQNAIYSRQ